jgi:hypothetical protein
MSCWQPQLLMTIYKIIVTQSNDDNRNLMFHLLARLAFVSCRTRARRLTWTPRRTFRPAATEKKLGYSKRKWRLCNQGCQMVYFQTKNPNLGNFWSAMQWKMLVNFMAIWSILLPFHIFYSHLVYFEIVLVYFFPFFLYQEKSGSSVSVTLGQCYGTSFLYSEVSFKMDNTRLLMFYKLPIFVF